MQAGRILVLEKSPRWKPELQRQLQSRSISVRACQQLGSVREHVTALGAVGTASPSCVAVLDTDGWGGECLPLITWLARRNVPVVVIGREGFELLEPSLREIGAAHVLLPPVAGSALASRCCLLLDRV